jgi:hypothetical protein
MLKNWNTYKNDWVIGQYRPLICQDCTISAFIYTTIHHTTIATTTPTGTATTRTYVRCRTQACGGSGSDGSARSTGWHLMVSTCHWHLQVRRHTAYLHSPWTSHYTSMFLSLLQYKQAVHSSWIYLQYYSSESGNFRKNSVALMKFYHFHSCHRLMVSLSCILEELIIYY